jgi:hypothetical protein
LLSSLFNYPIIIKKTAQFPDPAFVIVKSFPELFPNDKKLVPAM